MADPDIASPDAHTRPDERLWAECQRVIPETLPTQLPAELGKVDGCNVVMVDGNLVRVKHEMDFLCAGNDLEVKQKGIPYIPEKTFWLDGHIDRSEQVFNLYHESHERALMNQGMKYDEAHEHANAAERELRRRSLQQGHSARPYHEALGTLTLAALALDPGHKESGDPLSDEGKQRLAFLKEIASSGIDIRSLIASEGSRKYGSLQLTLPDYEAHFVVLLSRRIPRESLAGKGVELEPHITVLFGLDKSTEVAQIKQAVKDCPPVSITLGDLDFFPSQEQDVLFITVQSPDLEKLHKALNTLPHEDTHSEYRPHITMCYLKPGEGQRFKGRRLFRGTEMEFDSLEYSPAQGDKVQIPLNGSGFPEEKAPEPAEQLQREESTAVVEVDIYKEALAILGVSHESP